MGQPELVAWACVEFFLAGVPELTIELRNQLGEQVGQERAARMIWAAWDQKLLALGVAA